MPALRRHLPLMMLIGLIVVAFLPLCLGRRMFYLIDGFCETYPLQSIVNAALVAGPSNLPTWNPLLFCGMPLLADPQAQVYYPPALLFRFLSFASGYGCYVMLHVLISVTGMYAFLRGVRLPEAARIIGAAGYGLSTHAFLLMANTTCYASYSWLPWIAYFGTRLSREPSFAAIVSFGLLWAWFALAGYPQYQLYGFVLALIVGWRWGDNRPTLGTIAIFSVPVIGLALSAAMSVPSAAYIFGESARSHALAVSARSFHEFHPGNLIGCLCPYLVAPWSGMGIISVTPFWLTLHFVGTISMLLALLALSRFRHAVRPLILFLIALVFGMGKRLPLLGPSLATIPPFSFIRHPAMWMALAGFALSWMAGLGAARAEEILNGSRARRAISGLVVIAGLAFALGVGGWILEHVALNAGSFRWYEAGRMLSWFVYTGIILGLAGAILSIGLLRGASVHSALLALGYLTAVELIVVGFRLQPSVDPRLLLTPTHAEQRLKTFMECSMGWPAMFRWPSSENPGDRAADSVQAPTLSVALYGLRSLVPPNIGAVDGIRVANGQNPLIPALAAGVLARFSPLPDLRSPSDKALLTALGVRAVVSPFPVPGLSAPRYNGFVYVHELPNPVSEVGVMPEDAGGIDDFSARFTGWDVKVSLARPAVIRVNTMFSRGWRAYASPGGRTACKRVNGLFLGAAIDKGRHAVSFVYSPLSAGLGVLVSAFMLGFSLVPCIPGLRFTIPCQR